MGSFGAGLVGGLGAGFGIGSQLRDLSDEDAANKAMAATPEQVTPADEAPATAPAPDNAAPAAPETAATPAAPSAPKVEAPKDQWAIGEGEHRKVWDYKPSDEEVRQWRYDRILRTAGSKHADDFMEKELRRDALKRTAEKENMALRMAKQGEQDAEDLRTVQARQDTADNLAEAINANGGTVDSYLDATRGETDFTPLQRKVIQDAAGLAMDPTSRYRTLMRQAGVMRRSDPKAAMEFEKAATKQAAGAFISALEAEDAAATKSLYNIFPNGHMVRAVRFRDGNVIALGADGKTIVRPKRDLMIMAQAYADPDKAMSTMGTDERIASMERAQTQRNDIMEQRLRLAEARANAAGTGSGSGKGKKGGSADPDWIDLGKDIGLFKSDGDPQQALELLSHARMFHPDMAARPGVDQQQAMTDALMAGNNYLVRSRQFVEAYTKEKGKPPTAAEVQNAVAPTAIDPVTGIAARRMMIDPTDPGKGSYIYGKPLTAGAPAPVRAIEIGGKSGLATMITDLKANAVDKADAEAWDAAVLKATAGLPEAQRASALQAWGTAGLQRYVDTYVKRDPMKPQAAPAGATVSAEAPRSAEDVRAFGAAPKGLGAAVASYLKDKGRAALAAVDKPDMEEAVQLNLMRKEGRMSAGNVARFKELIARYPKLADEFGIDPVTFLPKQTQLATQ